MMFFSCGVETEFLSTPSARRATRTQHHHQPPARISIHALREEGDKVEESTRWADLKFLSTPSARRATEHQLLGEEPVEISIHALREEGDRRPPFC